MSGAGAPLARVPASTLAAYGLFGMPLAIAALPLYVHLPKFCGDHLGVNLAVLGSVLLVLRLADGAGDPLLGVLSDRGGARKRWLLLAAPLLAVGMIALFTPLPRAEVPLIGWLSVALVFVYGAFSLATINHQAWGAELSGDPVEHTRITAVREGPALFGVVIAAVLPAFLGGDDGGLGRFALLFAVFTLLCAAITVALTPTPALRRSHPPRGNPFASFCRGPHGSDRQLFRSVDAGDQAQLGARSRHRSAPAFRSGLCSRWMRPGGARRIGLRLRIRALRAQVGRVRCSGLVQAITIRSWS